MIWRKVLFFLLIAFCLTPYAFPPLIFAAGLIFALFFENPYPKRAKNYRANLYIISVIFFGFGFTSVDFKNSLNLGVVILFAAVFSILLIGFSSVKIFGLKRKTYPLISASVAVGGKDTVSAISPSLNIEEKDLSAALCVILLINSAAIIVFPIVGYFSNLTVYQYAVWTAIAIPDTLFALNGAAMFGADSLMVASANNLVRLLLLIPISYVLAYVYKEKKLINPAIPWLLFFFFLAFVVRNFLPTIIPPSFYESFVNLAKVSFTITIFLTASEFSLQTFENVGIKPLIFGFLLWGLSAIASLIAVTRLV